MEPDSTGHPPGNLGPAILLPGAEGAKQSYDWREVAFIAALPGTEQSLPAW